MHLAYRCLCGGSCQNHFIYFEFAFPVVLAEQISNFSFQFFSVFNHFALVSNDFMNFFHVQASHVNETEGSQANGVGQNQVGNESVPWQAFQGPSAPHAMQIPLRASTAIPFLNMVKD